MFSVGYCEPGFQYQCIWMPGNTRSLQNDVSSWMSNSTCSYFSSRCFSGLDQT